MIESQPKARVRPVIRLFVSSTFSDLKLERNALAQRVFPKLEQSCLQQEFQFQAIDLRWGVSTEAGLHHRTMQMCFEELRRSQVVSPQPNFLILLGDRYGWRPLPEEISELEFVQLAEHADGAAERAILKTWYRLDFNSIHPVHVLRARTDSPDGNDYAKSKDADGTLRDTEAWLQVQQALWRIVNRAFPPTELSGRFEAPLPFSGGIPSIVRFQASATEQEIWAGALNAPDAEHHVLAFFRSISNRGDFSPSEVEAYFDVTTSKEFDGDGHTAQKELKGAVRTRLGDDAIVPIPFFQLHRQNGKVVVRASETEIQKFCNDVETRLKTIIERQIREYWQPPATGARDAATSRDGRISRKLEIEVSEHLRFAREHAPRESFVGRHEKGGPLERIQNYLNDGLPYPLVVYGESGCGKTALLARAFQEIPSAKKPIVRFIGTTPRSSDIRSLLNSICQELRLRRPLGTDLCDDINLLRQELQDHFRAATNSQPVILFLDALDQLSDTDGGRFLNWIPFCQLPEHVRLVVSCLPDRDADPAGQPFRELQGRKLPSAQFVKLDALSVPDANSLLFDRWLPQAGRTVSNPQRKLLEGMLSHEPCRQPLYLKVLFEEARLWRSYDNPPPLGYDVAALLGQLFARLQRHDNHGPLLVDRVLGYLAAARRGLTENEIIEVVFADSDYRVVLDEANRRNQHELPHGAKRLPIVIWSRLRYDLAPFLTERSVPGGNVVTFYHHQVAQWVQKNFVEARDQDWQPHQRLAEYFDGQKLVEESLVGHPAQANPPRRRLDSLTFARSMNCHTSRRSQSYSRGCNTLSATSVSYRPRRKQVCLMRSSRILTGSSNSYFVLCRTTIHTEN